NQALQILRRLHLPTPRPLQHDRVPPPPPSQSHRLPPSPHPTSASLQSLLNDMERIRGSRITPRSLGSESSNPCRISPSPGVVHVWELRQRLRNGGARQLCWSAGCGVDADPWFDPLDPKHINGDSSARHFNSRGGHYVPLNPFVELDKLPSHAPLLTNRKRRLPTRADVGFANPTQEEIEAKMAEVQKECEWQECSPRICLLTGFGVKHAIDVGDDNSTNGDDVNEEGEVHVSCRKEMELWNGGKIPGVPFAGRDLIDAYKMYARFESLAKGSGRETNNQRKKYNPRAYSVFAPPVDAIPSSSSIWKPRPFIDRPPGMLYLLACPLELIDENHDGEPLFCTLALYMLPKRGTSTHASTDNNHKFKGKISEDFFFPAGNWNAIEGHESNQEQSWRRRKRRAVFSYDPLDVEEEDLFLVVQVFRMARWSDGGLLDDATSDDCKKEKKSTFGTKIKGTFRKAKSKMDVAGESANVPLSSPTEPHNNLHVDSPLGESGPRFLIPVSFGIVPAFPTNDPIATQQWPAGELMRSPFYSFPSMPESHEDFVDRLIFLSENLSSSADANVRSYAPTTSVSSTHIESSEVKPMPVSGHVEIFSSLLGQDFTQVLLQEPPEFCDMSDDDPPSANRPLLLADVMGETAIGFDGAAADEKKTKTLRSKLRRLPPTPASGYTSSFDIKEVLYLPPRFTKKMQRHLLLNLLYVYPRLIRLTDGWSQSSSEAKLSLRIRVVEQELRDQSFDGEEAVYQPLNSIYNPSTPAGPPLVESFFTKLVSGNKHGDSKTGRHDVPLKDEVKIRLPDVLDRRHFLQFSLFSISDGLDETVMAETAVPFIISSKESTSGGRVTTIIPNGLHRIQLGEVFQIHIETRLESTFHISDPAVATILRDYPLSSFIADQSSKVVNVQQPSVSRFVEILSMASGQAIKRHFLSLLTVHMISLINQPCPMYYFESLFDMFGSDTAWHRLVSWDTSDKLFSIIRSLFEILDKTRTCYAEKEKSVFPIKYQQLLKFFLDTFDEKIFSLKGDSSPAAKESEYTDSDVDGKLDDSFASNVSLKEGHYHDKITRTTVPELQTNFSMNSRKSHISMYRSPRSRTLGPPVFDAPFSRKAFVATRIEQMQAAAELYDDGNEYFEDDETVATCATTTSRITYATITSRIDRVSVPPVILESKSSLAAQDSSRKKDTSKFRDSTSNINYTTPSKRSPQNGNTSSSTPFSFASKRAEYMANRVNTMAQLVMAPCMAPNLSEDTLNGGNSSSGNSVGQSSNDRAPNSIWQSNKNPVEPGSDVEEEGNTKSFVSLRGDQACLKIPPLEFHLTTDSSVTYQKSVSKSSPYLYEIIITLWVHSWTSYAAQLDGERQVQGSSATLPSWPYEVVQGTNNPSAEEKVAVSFIRHIAFFLPLCLKSLAMRCAQCETTKLIIPMTFLDESHMQILLIMVESIALGAMREAMSGSSGVSNADQTIAKALSTSQHSLDFLVGLFALVHPSQVSTLVTAYFSVLNGCEDPIDAGQHTTDSMEKNLRRVKCARLLRLHAVEKLSVLPKFIALNYPLKYTGQCPQKNSVSCTWTHQGPNKPVYDSELRACSEKLDRHPQSFWLAECLMDQCLTISLKCCETIMVEARAQFKTSRYGKKAASSNITQGDLVRLEAIAFQAILSANNLLIKRHAMDSRFQSMESNARVAAMYVGPVLEKSIRGVSVLSRLEPNQKVRSCWMLVVLYVLQEAPEALLRDKLRSLHSRGKCDIIHCPYMRHYRIRDFVTLLTLASVTLQHLIIAPHDESFQVLGDRTREMTQESFNCLSASVILIIDECVDTVMMDTGKVCLLAKSVFDLLMHLLATPQSSVTLLRTLGVGSNLENWGRIILTLMNSTELSVRSMSVDFAVSLLGGVYNDVGSIDTVSLALLTVLPEVAAREIAFHHISGLTNSMDDVEVTLWPMRRAFADVEETNPVDDDRVDPQLMPSISSLCRTGQAIIDGVLVEIRLRGFDSFDLQKMKTGPSGYTISPMDRQLSYKTLFDADEESLFEAATFFSPESSLPQRLRWLLTLRDLHISKSQWVEAAETLILSANSIIESLPHLTEIWRPSRFDLWGDCKRSPWLSSIGLSSGIQIRGNEAVTEFSISFLEPDCGLAHAAPNCLSVGAACTTLSSIVDQAFLAFKESGLEDLAYHHFELLLNKLSPIVINKDRNFRIQDVSSLRRVQGNICAKLVRFDSMTLQEGRGLVHSSSPSDTRNGSTRYVRVILRGNKPERFKESTTIPTYFEWNVPSICRVPAHVIARANNAMSKNSTQNEEVCLCSTFAELYISALQATGDIDSVILRIGSSSNIPVNESNTFLDVALVQMKPQSRSNPDKSRKFFLRDNHGFRLTEFTVTHKFPHVLSRQRCLVTNEITPTNKSA
ncbi:LOW QUALITY PROTEIN: hypothetical protein HJC23_009369, partial [Cyclotella cryptica]